MRMCDICILLFNVFVMYVYISVIIESVKFSMMQLIMLLHTNTTFLFWANIGFLKMGILEYCVMLLVSFYMSAFF